MGIHDTATRNKGTQRPTCALVAHGGRSLLTHRGSYGQLLEGGGTELSLVGWMGSFVSQRFTDTCYMPGTGGTTMNQRGQTLCSEQCCRKLEGRICLAVTPEVTQLCGHEPRRVRCSGVGGGAVSAMV